ncbi:MAG: nucleoside deaminase [Cytophagales bacterium]|nr:nucleoside deaminase [Cytophagales bacterium]MDW8384909.1 nucleoside deaminase [Flammeovirgaceae bacterium]
MSLSIDDEFFMQKALQLAQKAFEEGEVPIGALVVCQNKIIGKGYNQTIKLQDATAHAEMLAITSASHYLGSRILADCTLYVTLEPCPMCAGAMYWANLGRLVFGAHDLKRGYQTIAPKSLHPKTIVKSGVLAAESTNLLTRFFQELREN